MRIIRITGLAALGLGLLYYLAIADKLFANTMNPTHSGIARVWHGYTTKNNAGTFEALLRDQVFPEIAANKPKGYRGAQLLKKEDGDRVEFTTIMWFDTIEAVKQFAGDDYETAHIDPSVRPLLLEYDHKSAHYDISYADYIP